jgi:hypothetical protein
MLSLATTDFNERLEAFKYVPQTFCDPSRLNIDEAFSPEETYLTRMGKIDLAFNRRQFQALSTPLDWFHSSARAALLLPPESWNLLCTRLGALFLRRRLCREMRSAQLQKLKPIIEFDFFEKLLDLCSDQSPDLVFSNGFTHPLPPFFDLHSLSSLEALGTSAFILQNWSSPITERINWRLSSQAFALNPIRIVMGKTAQDTSGAPSGSVVALENADATA